MNNRHWIKGQQICVYCNSDLATERDHVPPKGFFTKPLPSDVIVVPSCNKCNQDFSKNLDDEARAHLLSRMAYFSKSATSVWKEAILHGLAKHPSRAARIQKAGTRVRVQSPAGIYLGIVNAHLFPKPLFKSFIQRLVRGIHWHCFGEILAGDAHIEPFWVAGNPFKDQDVKEWLDSGPLHTHAQGQFKFKVFDGRPKDKRCFWVFELHDQVFGSAVCTWQS